MGAFNCFAPGEVNVLSCGCTGTAPNCDCGNGPTELPADCHFADESPAGGETCAIVCAPPAQTQILVGFGGCTFADAIRNVNAGGVATGSTCPFVPGLDRQTIVLPATPEPIQVTGIIGLVNPVTILGANAGTPGYATRGPESTLQFAALPTGGVRFYIGPNDAGIGGQNMQGAGTIIDGVTLLGPGVGLGGENYAIGGWRAPAEGFTLENSIVTAFGSGASLGGDGGTISGNWFHDNNGTLGLSGSGIVSQDIYPAHNTLIKSNLITNQDQAGINLTSETAGAVSGQTLEGNIIVNVPSGVRGAGADGAVQLNNVQDIQALDNVLVSTNNANRGFFMNSTSNIPVNGLVFSGNTVTGFQTGFAFTGNVGAQVNNNRIVGNVVGIDVTGVTNAAPPAPIDANDNWWGSNGGPGSMNASGETANAITPTGTNLVAEDRVRTLTCSSMPEPVTTGSEVNVTGQVIGLPTVTNAPEVMGMPVVADQPEMDAMPSAGIVPVNGAFPHVPSNGVSGGTVIPGGGSLMGAFTVNASGTVTVSLDGEDAICTVTAD